MFFTANGPHSLIRGPDVRILNPPGCSYPPSPRRIFAVKQPTAICLHCVPSWREFLYKDEGCVQQWSPSWYTSILGPADGRWSRSLVFLGVFAASARSERALVFFSFLETPLSSVRVRRVYPTAASSAAATAGIRATRQEQQKRRREPQSVADILLL